MAFRLIPKEERFYDDFTAMAEQIQHGAELLDEMLAPDRPIWDKADEIKEVEHKCDFLTHEIIQRLNRTFVTPLDREDIHDAGPFARRRDGRDRRVGDDRPPLSHRKRPPRRARADAAGPRFGRPGRLRDQGAREAQGRRRVRRRDQPPRERGGPRPPGRRVGALQGREGRHRRSSSGRRSWTSSSRPPIAARTSPTCSKASS